MDSGNVAFHQIAWFFLLASQRRCNGNTRLVGSQGSTETYPSTPVLLKAGTPRVLSTRECISLWLNSVKIKLEMPSLRISEMDTTG